MGRTPLRVICLVGPTGAGKTAAALHLARALGGEVVNADSRQVYRDFPIITAQPSPEERAVCRHHLYGFLHSEEKISAGQWAARAAAEAAALQARGVVPILVGGTGLYFKALLEGIADIPPVDPAVTRTLTEECAASGPEALHLRLQEVDPVYAARIHPHDRQRIIRALEVAQGTGRSFSWWHEHASAAPLCVGLRLGLQMDLAKLTPRLERRIGAMLKAGALEEAREARRRCGDAAAPGWSGIGCAELYRHLAGELPLEDACALWARNTRAYAKRQLTWFRADSQLRWCAPDDVRELLRLAEQYIAAF